MVNVIDGVKQQSLPLKMTEQSGMPVVEQPVSVFSKTERLSLPQMSFTGAEHT